MNWIEWIGYLAAGFVVASFLVKNMRLLRSINMMGAMLFIVYGIFLDVNLPVIIPNVFIVCIQFYYLFIRKGEKANG
jgi:hypothetical protein